MAKKASKKSLHIACSCDDGENLNVCCKSSDAPTATVIAEGNIPLGKFREGLQKIVPAIKRADPDAIQYSYSGDIPRETRLLIAETVGAAVLR